MKYYCEFEVEGRGDFPLDMLRYDQCVPVRPEDADRIRRPDGKLMDTVRTIRLRAYLRADPTYRRWSSFGWVVKMHSVNREKMGS